MRLKSNSNPIPGFVSDIKLCATEPAGRLGLAGARGNEFSEGRYGGRGEIRTHETLAGLPVFKTGALNHSATLPAQQLQTLTDILLVNASATG
jgi:hypothetical protein